MKIKLLTSTFILFFQVILFSQSFADDNDFVRNEMELFKVSSEAERLVKRIEEENEYENFLNEIRNQNNYNSSGNSFSNSSNINKSQSDKINNISNQQELLDIRDQVIEAKQSVPQKQKPQINKDTYDLYDVVKFDDVYNYAGKKIGYVSRYPNYANWRDNEQFFAEQQTKIDRTKNSILTIFNLIRHKLNI